MSDLVPELASLPSGSVLDGELVAWGDDELPSFPRLCERMLQRGSGIAVKALSTQPQPYRERRGILEALELDKPPSVRRLRRRRSLVQVVCDRGMEVWWRSARAAGTRPAYAAG